MVQLRTEEDELLQLASRGLIDQFYSNEIEIRKALQYPPYSVFVLLSFKGSKEQTEEIEEMLTHVLAANEIQFYSAPLSNKKETLRYGLLRIEASKWPKADLVDRLRSLPPYIKIEINPDRIV
jgi:primosomal protein N'